MMHKLETLNNQVSVLQNALAQTHQQSQQLTQLQAFQQQVVQLKNQFASTTPDFDAAITHLRNTRIADLRTFGMSDQQIAQQLAQEEFSVAEISIANGRNPAQVLYDMSKRHGYQPTAAPAPGAPAPSPAPAASLDAIQRAQAAARTLPAAPAPATEITLDNLKAASDADLNKMVMDPALWGQISGKNDYPL